MPEPRSTGMPRLDAQNDFMRARRHAAASRVAARLRGEPGDVRMVLPYEEVIEALGFVSESSVGVEVVALDAIVGTVDRERDFDRSFRPTSGRVRSRWENIAAAMRRGESLPPVDLVRIGEIYFVRDGHNRVSVARALGRRDIDAHVTEVTTRVGAGKKITLADLPVNSHERHEAIGRRETAFQWLENEYRPVVEMLREADLIGNGTETEAYMRVSAERYRLIRTHRWDEEVIRRLIEGGARKTRRRP